jgi:hypothetical protein
MYHTQAINMATNAIIASSNLDISKVSFGDIRSNKAGGKTVPIKYNGQSLQIRLPKMSYPMGVSIKENENGVSYTLSATLRGCDHFAKERAGADAGELGTLYNFLQDLQDALLDTATKKSVAWFGKSRNKEVLAELVKQNISPSVEKVNGEWVPTGKYPPSFRMKVPVYDGRVSMDVADGQGRPVEVTVDNLGQVFPKRVEASIVVSPSVYVSGTGFGVTWRISYARVTPAQRLTAAQVFADEIEEEVKVGTSTVVDADEEEHLEVPSFTEPEPAPAPAPEPAPAQQTGVKNRRRVAVSSGL